jgi:hypothetical protein
LGEASKPFKPPYQSPSPIAAIEGCTSNAAKLRMNKLINDENISEGANSEFKKFKYDTTK